MTVEIFCVCDSVTKTASGLTLQGVASHLLVSGFPFVLPQLCVVARVRFDLSEEGAHEFRFVSLTADAGHALPDKTVVNYAKQVDEGFVEWDWSEWVPYCPACPSS